MIKLNLQATTPEMEVVKTYLEENASEILAGKINNGVHIQKDGKTLINKKTLESFMEYAHEEAKKLAAKGARYACIKDDIVFGWSIHYFEKDSIEGKLFNQDATEYKPVSKPIQRIHTPSAPIKSTIHSNKPSQFSLFDLLDKKEDAQTEIIEEPEQAEISELNVDMETGEILSKEPIQQSTSPIYRKYLEIQAQYPDSAIAYRLGDFYEIFGDNAIKIANEVELTLTGRDCGLPTRVPMIGFPYHASDTYFKKISALYPLIIVENNVITPYTSNIESEKDKNKPTMYEDNDDFAEELALNQFFDKEALCVLYELFNYQLDIQ